MPAAPEAMRTSGARRQTPMPAQSPPLPPLEGTLASMIAAGPYFGRRLAADPRRINVGLPPAPTADPLTVDDARAAVVGDVIARLLEWQGHVVQREWFVREADAQAGRLGEALWARVQRAVGRAVTVPDAGPNGEHLGALAQRLLAKRGWLFADQVPAAGIAQCQQVVAAITRTQQRETLAAFRVAVDLHFEAGRLHAERTPDRVLAALGAAIDDWDGALGLRAPDGGVAPMRSASGAATGLLLDVAYLADQAARGFDRAIALWPAAVDRDEASVRAALEAMGQGAGFLSVVPLGPVAVTRGAVPVPARSGRGAMTLRELVDTVGVDPARYGFAMTPAGEPLAFDLDAIAVRSEDNPAWLVPLAQTRLEGVFHAGGIDPARVDAAGVDANVLSDPGEAELVRLLAAFPDHVHRAADTLAPSRVTRYGEELARASLDWQRRCPALAGSARARRARLAVTRAASIVLKNVLDLLGLSAPGRLEHTREAG